MKRILAGTTEKPSAMEAENGMIELNRLDEADVRHDRCPVCKNKELNRLDGFKVCPRCNTNFKILDGRAYIIDNGKGEINIMENRIVARLRKMAENESISTEIQAKIKELAVKHTEMCAEALANDDEMIYDFISNNEYEPDFDDLLVDQTEAIEQAVTEDLETEDLEITDAINKAIADAVRNAVEDYNGPAIDLFESACKEMSSQVEEDKEIEKDPWRGTGMSQSDFI